MSFLCLLLLAASALGQSAADKQRVAHATIAALEKSFDAKVMTVSAADPLELMSSTQGVYLEGFGAVFTAQVDLIVTPTPNPFRQTLSKHDIKRVRERKVERLPVLKGIIKQMMMESASALSDMPPGEQVVFAVSLFHLNWEDTAGLPAQIVMRAQRQQLLARAVADSAIDVQER